MGHAPARRSSRRSDASGGSTVVTPPAGAWGKRKQDGSTASAGVPLNKPSVPVGVLKAWNAHHVIRATDRRSRDLQALMFRCGIHPNEQDNGIYLRDVGLKKKYGYRDNQEWVNLNEVRPDLANRTYHYDTFGALGTDRDYFTMIRDMIGGFDNERYPLGDSPRPAVKEIKKKLAINELGVQRDGN